MSELKLRHKYYEGGISARFRESTQPCPRCSQHATRDDWPPDYAGGQSTSEGSEWSGSAKFVCVPCRIAFRVTTKGIWRRGQYEETRTISGEQPLVERAGYLLTEYDVEREEYFEKHGEYRHEAYG